MKGLLCTNKFHGWKPLQLAWNKHGFTFEHSSMNIEEDFFMDIISFEASQVDNGIISFIGYVQFHLHPLALMHF